MEKISLCLITAFFLGTVGCSKSPAAASVQPESAAPRLPQDWYRLPEDGGPSPLGSALTEPVAEVGEGFDETLAAQQDVLEGLTPPEEDSSASALTGNSLKENSLAENLAAAPSNFVPWHLSAFMTDLSVSATGILGSLTAKGQPAISLIWRKKEAAAKTPMELEAAADIAVSSDMPANQVDSQLDAAVHAAMATGRVQDETKLRKGLGQALADFQSLTSGLDTTPGQEWFASRIRMDVLIDASGKVAFFTSVGAEVRLRFEWHRIKHPTAHAMAATLPVRAAAQESQRSFNELVTALASDLTVLSAPGSNVTQGYQPYLFRIGVGVTAGGTFGVVKSNATAIGQVYFSRDVPKPSTHSTIQTKA